MAKALRAARSWTEEEGVPFSRGCLGRWSWGNTFFKESQVCCTIRGREGLPWVEASEANQDASTFSPKAGTSEEESQTQEGKTPWATPQRRERERRLRVLDTWRPSQVWCATRTYPGWTRVDFVIDSVPVPRRFPRSWSETLSWENLLAATALSWPMGVSCPTKVRWLPKRGFWVTVVEMRMSVADIAQPLLSVGQMVGEGTRGWGRRSRASRTCRSLKIPVCEHAPCVLVTGPTGFASVGHRIGQRTQEVQQRPIGWCSREEQGTCETVRVSFTCFQIKLPCHALTCGAMRIMLDAFALVKAQVAFVYDLVVPLPRLAARARQESPWAVGKRSTTDWYPLPAML